MKFLYSCARNGEWGMGKELHELQMSLLSEPLTTEHIERV